MTEYDITRKSHPVIVSEYDPQWAVEFKHFAQRIRGLVGSAAIRIDHIGSTSVSGLASKDVIDLQVTVVDLNRADDLTVPLRDAGFRRGAEFVYDEFWTMPETDPQLRKLYMREPDGERPAHIHIRELERFNQRYALLFRDYLRSSETVRKGYEEVKRRAARLFPDSIDGYLFLKDPVFHIIYEAACLWAMTTGWAPDDEYL